MTTVDSGLQRVGACEGNYASLAPESWGQPPASYYYFIVDGTTLYGQIYADIYVASSHRDLDLMAELELAAELEAWDQLSDEALSSFEAGLD